MQYILLGLDEEAILKSECLPLDRHNRLIRVLYYNDEGVHILGPNSRSRGRH